MACIGEPDEGFKPDSDELAKPGFEDFVPQTGEKDGIPPNARSVHSASAPHLDTEDDSKFMIVEPSDIAELCSVMANVFERSDCCGMKNVQAVEFVDSLGVRLDFPSSLVNQDKETLDINPNSPLIRRLAIRGKIDRSDANVRELCLLMAETGLWPESIPISQLGRGGHGGDRPNSGDGGGCCIILSDSIDGRPSIIHFEDYGRLKKRDFALTAELDYGVEGQPNHQPRVIEDENVEVDFPAELISYAPMFYSVVTDGELPSARNKLFALSEFFHAHLTDRTETITDEHVRVKVLDPLPEFDPHFSKSLQRICDERAREIYEKSVVETEEGVKKLLIEVMWSGGIDSTAALIALIRTGTTEERSRIVVRYHMRAMEEYPLFYENYISGKLNEEVFEGEIGDQVHEDRITVTGECGDQLFGSLLMERCFEGSYGIPQSENPEVPNRFLHKLDAPWKDTVIPTMQDRLLLKKKETEVNDWLMWITPQLQKSPIPIVSTFDFLWWMNISLKWQQVTVRMLNRRDDLTPELFSRVQHFYRTEDFQKWSFVNHNLKMPDKSKWDTYKWPLKEYIYDFTHDEDYLQTKVKVGSLRHTPSKNFAIDANFNIIQFGGYSISKRRMREKYGDKLMSFIKKTR